MKSILGKKIGMTRIFDADGVVTPVTVVEAGPCVVTQIKTLEKDGYSAAQIGFGDIKDKHVTKPLKGHFEAANTGARRYLREVELEAGEELTLGTTFDCSVFAEGDVVDVIGTSKGKGTQGAIKRWNYGRGPSSHGSKSHRVAGARAAGSYPARVFPGKKGSGKTGHERVTVQNLKVVRSEADKNLLLIKGAIPGPKGGLVIVRKATKAAN